MLENYEIIREGCWPPEGRDSGYIGEDRSMCLVAPFEAVVQVAAELSVRLEATGVDGKLLLKEVESGVTHIESLEYESRRALRYICGSRRKTERYKTWVRKRKYRWQKGGIFVSG